MNDTVLCKDCKHRPSKPENYKNGFDLDFPDWRCPCRCDDDYYSWYPDDNWYCANGEKKEEKMKEPIKDNWNRIKNDSGCNFEG